MGRRSDPARREQLLETVVDLMLERGLNDIALRTLAGALNTSTYTFVYHFGTKDQLVAECLDRASARLSAQLDKIAASGAGTAERLRAMWRWSIDEDRLLHLRLMADAVSLGRNEPEPYNSYLATARGTWRAALGSAMSAGGACEQAGAVDLIEAAWFGLATDLMSGHDRAAVDAAFEGLIAAALR